MTVITMPDPYFDLGDFRHFLNRYPTYGEAENKPLYFLFDMDRAHTDLETTKAKFKYVDRIYNANIGNFIGRAGVDTRRQIGPYWLAEKNCIMTGNFARSCRMPRCPMN